MVLEEILGWFDRNHFRLQSLIRVKLKGKPAIALMFTLHLRLTRSALRIAHHDSLIKLNGVVFGVPCIKFALRCEAYRACLILSKSCLNIIFTVSCWPTIPCWVQVKWVTLTALCPPRNHISIGHSLTKANRKPRVVRHRSFEVQSFCEVIRLNFKLRIAKVEQQVILCLLGRLYSCN